MPAANPDLDHELLLRRLDRYFIFIAIAGIAVWFVAAGWPAATGWTLGALGSWWNFRGLKRIVASLGTPRFTGKLGSFALVLFRLIVLIASAFVILRFTKISLPAALAGLFVSVGAVAAEAVRELVQYGRDPYE